MSLRGHHTLTLAYCLRTSAQENYSLSGEFHVLSKLIVCAVMLRGRHRGLPDALDRAVLLPREFSKLSAPPPPSSTADTDETHQVNSAPPKRDSLIVVPELPRQEASVETEVEKGGETGTEGETTAVSSSHESHTVTGGSPKEEHVAKDG